MVKYDVFALHPLAPTDDVSAGVNLNAAPAAALARAEADAGRNVRVVHNGNHGKVAGVYEPEGGWVLDDTDLREALLALG